MKKYVYELMYREAEIDYTSSIGFFTSLPKVREYIIEDGSPRSAFVAWRHELNPKEEETEAVAVEIKWES